MFFETKINLVQRVGWNTIAENAVLWNMISATRCGCKYHRDIKQSMEEMYIWFEKTKRQKKDKIIAIKRVKWKSNADNGTNLAWW